MIVDYVKHNEAVIQHFAEDPEYADLYLRTVIEDGDEAEIQEVRSWYNESKTRAASMSYWSSLIDNAEQTARDGQNLDAVIELVTRALGILKAAVPANA